MNLQPNAIIYADRSIWTWAEGSPSSYWYIIDKDLARQKFSMVYSMSPCTRTLHPRSEILPLILPGGGALLEDGRVIGSSEVDDDNTVEVFSRIEEGAKLCIKIGHSVSWLVAQHMVPAEYGFPSIYHYQPTSGLDPWAKEFVKNRSIVQKLKDIVEQHGSQVVVPTLGHGKVRWRQPEQQATWIAGSVYGIISVG